jgi:hypothetical protein
VHTGEQAQLSQGPRPLPEDGWEAGTGAIFVGGGREIRRHRMPRRSLWAAVLVVAMIAAGIGAKIVFQNDAEPSHPIAGESPSPDPGAPVSPGPAPSVTATLGGALVVAPPALPPAFEPIVVEAEAGMPQLKLRGASVIDLAGASGGRAAQFTSPTGSMELRQVTLPAAGEYRIMIVYASGGAFTGELRAGGASAAVRFAANTSCCAVATVDLALGTQA